MTLSPRDWEAIGRFEVKGYFYRFHAGIDEAVFECERCGALVGYASTERHDNFHKLFAVIVATTS